jgi:hypothetical protein
MLVVVDLTEGKPDHPSADHENAVKQIKSDVNIHFPNHDNVICHDIDQPKC